MHLPKQYAHYLFATIQAGFTTAFTAAIASAQMIQEGTFLSHWLKSWLIAWAAIIPFVLVAAPFIRRFVDRVCR